MKKETRITRVSTVESEKDIFIACGNPIRFGRTVCKVQEEIRCVTMNLYLYFLWRSAILLLTSISVMLETFSIINTNNTKHNINKQTPYSHKTPVENNCNLLDCSVRINTLVLECHT